MRGDLPRGIQAANIVHAAGESAGGPLPSGTCAVCLVVAGQDALRDVAARLERAGVRHRPIVESEGRHAGEMMALGCAPARKEVVGRHVSSLPLLK